MSKKQFKSSASSARVGSGAFNVLGGGFSGLNFGSTPSSQLSYIFEPPDYAILDDPQLVVAVKGLLKRESVTRAKALEEISSIFSAQPEEAHLQESFLPIWTVLYPRIAIDNDRRVRQLAHGLQGNLSLVLRKRIVKQLPSLISTWLGGAFDPDRVVARAAKQALEQTFSSAEKQQGVWKTYKTSIIQFCAEALTNETAATLSDERITVKDEAEAKYHRLLSTSLFMLSEGFEVAGEEFISDDLETIQSLFSNSKIVALAHHEDSNVRKGLYAVTRALLHYFPDTLDVKQLAKHLIKSGLTADQTNSLDAYLQTLAATCSRRSAAWQQFYEDPGKKSAFTQLSKFLHSFSSSSPVIWQSLDNLVSVLPENCLYSSESSSDDSSASQPTLLQSLRHAISGPLEDPKPAQLPQWQVYVRLSERLLSLGNDRVSYKPDILLQTEVWPLVEAHVSATKGGIWQSPETIAPLLAQLVVKASGSQTAVVQRLLSEASNTLTQTMQLSLPQQAKGYEESQAAVQHRAVRWHYFESQLVTVQSSTISEMILSNTKNELSTAFDLLKSRQGKPWGSAAVLLSATTTLKAVIHPALDEFMVSRLTKEVKMLMQSRSAGLIATCVCNLENEIPALKTLMNEALTELAQSEPSENIDYALVEVIPIVAKQDEEVTRSVHESVVKRLDLLVTGTQEVDDFSLRVANSPATPEALLDVLLARLAVALEAKLRPSLVNIIEGLTQHHLLWLHGNITQPSFRTLYEALKSLAKTAPDSVLLEHAARCSTTLDSIVYQDVNKTTSTGTTLQFLADSITTVSAGGISTGELLQQYHLLWSKLSFQERQDCVDQLTNDVSSLLGELSLQIQGPLPSELAVTNLLGDAILLVERESVNDSRESISYDQDGLSITIRRLLVILDLLATNDTETTKLSFVPEFLAYCAVLTQVATDQCSVPATLRLSDRSRPVSEIATLVSRLQAMTNAQFTSTIAVTSSQVEDAARILDKQCKGRGKFAYYSARALVAVLELWRESVGDSAARSKFADIKPNFRPEADTLFSSILPLALISGQSELERALNTLLSELAAPNRKDQLYQLVQLNYILRSSDCDLARLPPQRLLFFIRQVAENLKDSTLAAEILRAFELIAPSVATIYDDFWDKFVSFTTESLNQPCTHLPRDIAVFKVLKVLSKLANEDSNDDLKEVWQSQQANVQQGLMMKLVEFGDREPPLTQAQQIANDMLSRLVAKLPVSNATKAIQLYPVLAGESLTLQTAAYELLHRLVPSQQEEMSMESALNASFVAKLPDELLSLVISQPAEASLEADDHVMISSKLSSYFLGWALVFDHWTNASLKVQSELTDHVRSDAQPEMLFNVLVATLTHPHLNNALINPSKYELTSPMSLEEQGSRTAAQSWACYLFYLALLRIPSIGRTWWRDSCPRGLNRVVEEWIEKYISPVISQAELDNVTTWLSSQPDPTDGPPLDVKVNHKAREITVSYPVDESFMIMRIRIPPTYPLSSIGVESVQRLAVSEKQWQSWLITTSGIINFQSGGSGTGSIIDGLVAWRKNIVGALKGQSECAICYSIVGVSKDLPTKRCATCKNMFHGSCLLKWFKSSSSSSCPLCRNQFKF